MLQQVQQFVSLGEDFAMQHAFSEDLQEVKEELLTKILEAVPVERRLRGLPPDEVAASLSEKDDLLTKILDAVPLERRLRGLPPEEVLRALPQEELLRALPQEALVTAFGAEEAARLRELLDRKQAL
jgi:hypothetical protein